MLKNLLLLLSITFCQPVFAGQAITGNLTVTGNVGIGTTILPSALDLPQGTTSPFGITFGTDTNLYRPAASTLQTDGSFTVGTVLLVTNASVLAQVFGSVSPSGNLVLDSTFDSTKGNIIVAPTAGNVGIGTTLPVKLLQVGGNMFLDRTTSTIFMREPDGTCGSCTLSNSEVFTCVSATCP